MALVAKGAKRPSSNFRPVLLPLQPLLLSWGGEGEIRTLKAAEWGGGLVMPTGDSLLSGFYANELLLRMLAREDAYPRLFDAYAALVHVLAVNADEGWAAAALRAFELLLLREAGHLPALDVQTLTLAPLVPAEPYRLEVQGGLRVAHADDGVWLAGSSWRAIADALETVAPYSAVLEVLTRLEAEQRVHLRRQVRELLHYHCGMNTLRTPSLLLDLRRLNFQAPTR